MEDVLGMQGKPFWLIPHHRSPVIMSYDGHLLAEGGGLGISGGEELGEVLHFQKQQSIRSFPAALTFPSH